MQRSSVLRVLRWIALGGVTLGLFMPLVFVKEVIFPFVFSKLLFFQIVIGLSFPAYLLLAWMDPASRPKKHSIVIALALYFVAMGVSVVTSVDVGRSWWGNQERMNGYFTLLHFFAWFLMASSLLTTWKAWERVLRVQVIIGGFVALSAIWQKWVNPELFFYTAVGRVGGILDNPIYQGMYQMFMFFLLALLASRTRVRAWWAAYGVLTLLGLGGFLASQSRGPLVGLFAGILVAAGVYGFLSKERRNRLMAAAGLGSMILAYGALYLARGTEVVRSLGLERFVAFQTTTTTRLIAWKIAWEAFLERSFSGWGLDTFHIIFSANYNPISLRYTFYETWFDRSHNTILDVLAMTGAFGLVTYLAIFGALFYALYRAYKQGWVDLSTTALLAGLPVAYFVQNLFVFDHPAGFMASYAMFALFVAATRQGFFAGSSTVSEDVVVGKERSWSWLLAAPLIAGALLLVWRGSVQPAQASYLTIRSSQLFPQASALQDLQRAMAIKTPYRDEQVFLISRNLVGVGQRLTQVPDWKVWLELGKTAADFELARHPRNTYLRYMYARLLGDTAFAVPEQNALAEEQFLKAIETSPKRQQLYEGLSRLYLRQRRMDDALVQLKQNQEFDPDNGFGDWQMGVVQLFDLGNEREGAEFIVQAIQKPFPYRPGSPREYVPIFHAYRILERGQELEAMTEVLLAKTDQEIKADGDQPLYQFPYQARLAGRNEAEERLVQRFEQVYPGFQQRYLASIKQIQEQEQAQGVR